MVIKNLNETLKNYRNIHDDNIENILLEIPVLIEEAKKLDNDYDIIQLMEIYLRACSYISHYTQPYLTLKRLDDITAEWNGEMYIGKYSSVLKDKYFEAYTLGRAQQYYGKALNDLLRTTENAKELIDRACLSFEYSVNLLQQIDPNRFKGREQHILQLYLAVLTLFAKMGKREEFLKYFEHVFTWNLDFSTEACNLLFYQMEIIMLTLDKHYQSAIAIYRQFIEVEDGCYIATIGDFIMRCYEQVDNRKEYERFLTRTYRLECEKYSKLDHCVLESLLRNRKKLTLDIYIDSFEQVFNVIGGKPAVYKFN